MSDDLIKQLFDEHSRAVLSFANRIAHDRGLGEDICQQTFLRAFSFIASHGAVSPETANYRSWLFKIARNIERESRRRVAVRGSQMSIDEQDEGAEWVTDPQAVMPHEAMAQAEAREALRHCIESIEENLRSIVMMKHFDDLSHTEIASLLRISNANSRVSLFRGMAQLRTCIEGRTGGEAG